MTVRVLQCPKCSTELGADFENRPDGIPCLECENLLLPHVFPAFHREMPTGAAGEKLLHEEEASCFFHVGKRAVVSCEGCGRFLCALCDVEFNSKHLCPACLEAGTKKGKIAALESQRLNHNRLVFYLAVIPILMWFLTFLTAPIALYMGIRNWNSPRSLVSPSRGLMITGMIIAVLEILGWTVGFLAVFKLAPWSAR